MFTTLIDADTLRQALAGGSPPLLMDCSFDLMNPEAGRQQFESGHLPGAIHVDLDRHLSDKTGPDRASGGRHPLPSRDNFAERLRALGLNPGVQVVVMDRQGANYCGRLWWMLKWCGHEAVAVLDGGLAAWTAAGGELVAGPSPVPARGGFVLGPPQARTMDAPRIKASLGDPGAHAGGRPRRGPFPG